MIMATPKNFFVQRSLLVLMVLVAALTKADSSSSSFQCGNPQEAIEINPTGGTTTTSSSSSSLFFDTIETSLQEDNWKNRNSQQLMPQKIHWHIYAIDNGETAKYSCYPEGLVEPQISGSTLHLVLVKNRLNELGYHRGDKIQSAINLYVPLQQLRNIQLDGVGEIVEVIVTDKLLPNATMSSSSSLLLPSIRIRTTGVDSNLYVNAPYSPIYLSGSGVDTDATISAGRNSTVQLSGVDERIRIKSEHLNGKIRLSGVSTRLMVDGDYDSIDMSGVSCKVLVNGPSGCNYVHNSGVDNNCGVPSSSDSNINITVPELDCLSNTTVVEGYCDFSVGAMVGVSIALILVIGLCVFGCIHTRRRRRRCQEQQQQQQQQKQVTSSLQVPVGSSVVPPGAAVSYDPQKVHVVEAEVIGIEPSTTTTMDPEQAKGTDAKVYGEFVAR